MTPRAIELSDVRCTANGRTLLRIDALSIAAGERIALIGSNGAGKSTLMRLLSGFRRASSGRVAVFGEEFSAAMSARDLRRLRRGIGQVFQGLNLVMRLTAHENVALGALGRLTHRGDVMRSWVRAWSREIRDEADEKLAALGIDALAGQRVQALSGGERQKVAIARMLMQRPRLVLADEPTANLDAPGAAQFSRLVTALPADVTVISVVHDPALIPDLATRVVALKDGAILFDGPAGDVDGPLLARLHG